MKKMIFHKPNKKNENRIVISNSNITFTKNF